MGNMIGSGVFLLPASLAPYGWDAVAGWVLTIGGALAVAFVLARLTRALPGARGPIEMVDAAFGPFVACLIGWSYWVSIWTANVTIAVAAVSYLSLFLPIIGRMTGLAAFSAFLLLWLLTLVNLRGARAAGNFQIVTLVLKLIPLAVVGVIILFVAIGPSGESSPPFPTARFSVSGITASAALTLWALLGFESASVAADKAARSSITIPRATLLGTLLTGLIYLVVCSGIALLLPRSVAAASAAPFADFVARYWAPGPAYFIGLFAAISAIGALNGWILLQGELPLSMARSAMLPPWLAATDAHGTPRRALILSSLCASLLLLANSLRAMADLFTFMALLSTSAALWLYLACAASALRLGVALPAAAIAFAYALWTLWGAGLAPSGLSLILMLSGLPLYWLARRARPT